MDDVQLLYASRPATPSEGVHRELTRVALLSSVTGDDGTLLPEGATGTVVAVWGDGAAYEVDFGAPYEDLAVVEASGLRAVA
jgi:hypothetical protein